GRRGRSLRLRKDSRGPFRRTGRRRSRLTRLAEHARKVTGFVCRFGFLRRRSLVVTKILILLWLSRLLSGRWLPGWVRHGLQQPSEFTDVLFGLSLLRPLVLRRRGRKTARLEHASEFTDAGLVRCWWRCDRRFG